MELSMEELHKLCAERKFKWSAHILTRLQQRDIQPSDVRNCIRIGKIIEQYPTDYPYPSCLVLGRDTKQNALHVVVGVGEGFLWLVTAYHPDPDEWENDYATRKERTE